MQLADASNLILTCCSSPRPASLPVRVRVFPERVTVSVTKCGFPAKAGTTETAAVVSTRTRANMIRRMEDLLNNGNDAVMRTVHIPDGSGFALHASSLSGGLASDPRQTSLELEAV